MPGLVAADQIGFEFQAVQFNRHRAFEGTDENAVGFRQVLRICAKRTSLRSMMARGEKIFCSAATIMRLALVHAERGNLHDQHVLVFVHDEAAQEIALGVDDAEGGGLGQMPFADGERGADAFLKKCFVDLDAFRREHADVDLGFGIVKADAEQPLAMVFDLHERAVAAGAVRRRI